MRLPQPPVPDAERLRGEVDRLLGFAAGAVHPDGGFALLDDEGRPQLDQPVHAYVTARMTHVFSLGHLLGRPGDGALADAGVAALSGRLRDGEHGGWFGALGPTGLEDPASDLTKGAYAHAFVVLAAASATAAGRPGAPELLDDALGVLERRFWREDDGMLVEEWDRAFSALDPYRGVNANMHGVEAMLTAADVTGREQWRARALRIAERVVHGFAREAGWRLPEHFDAGWNPLPDYNSDDRAHPFRPYGVTTGHLLEWSRLCLHLRASLGAGAPVWLLDDAVALFDTAVREGWRADGHEGFVYTTDFDGAPVVTARMHWVVTEGIAAAAAMYAATGEPAYADRYEEWWDHAERLFVDREKGSWRHELDARGRPATGTWSGKPDVYHAVQACLVPQLPLTPMLPAALRDASAPSPPA
ncbi:AGE family epimerase/isomerase [Quadrisphaera sp. DSM 44207]|uniref:AGE family epimerase/isomerase n=1 Tax=Quadrisphaera sp. DSM 44207 TaxID=1881057 RepID=UPI000B82B36F